MNRIEYWLVDAGLYSALAIALSVPIGLTLWQRGRRGKNAADRFVVWFRSELFYRQLLLTVWCVWPFIAIPAFAASSLGVFLAGISGCGQWMWTALFFLLPPALTVIACKVLSASAFAGVPEMGWTRGRLLQQALWLQLGIVAVGVCLGHAADAEAANSSSGGLLSAAAAFGVLLVSLTGWFRSRQVAQDVLPPGELRERLFELAEQAQVRVRQGCLLSSAAWRLINVLVLIDDNIYLTPELLPHLSRREVDALMALELGRLLRRGHFNFGRFGVLLLLFLAYGVLAGILAFFVRVEFLRAIWILPIVFALLFRSRAGHRFASVLDRHALAVTGDPEALITLLAKLHRLQMLPLAAGEEVHGGPRSSVHPTDWPRLQKIARMAHIPPERLREILDRPGSGEDRYPPLPVTSVPSEEDMRVFSRNYKRRSLSRQTWAAAAVESAALAAAAYAVQSRQCGAVGLIAAYVLGLPLAVLLRRVVLYQIALRGTLILRRGIRRKLEKDGVTPEAWGGLFVGLSPHAEPRNYENFLVWDLGYLILSGDRLCYLGDRTRFALDRAFIQDAYLGPGPPEWRTHKRLYIVWRDARSGLGGTINLTLSEARSPWRRAPRTEQLAQRLREWRNQPAATLERPLPLRELPPPDFRSAASESLARIAAVSSFLGLLILRAPFVLVASFLLGLSFEEETWAGGWYIVWTVVLLQGWTVLSYLHYRGRGKEGDPDAVP